MILSYGSPFLTSWEELTDGIRWHAFS